MPSCEGCGRRLPPRQPEPLCNFCRPGPPLEEYTEEELEKAADEYLNRRRADTKCPRILGTDRPRKDDKAHGQ